MKLKVFRIFIISLLFISLFALEGCKSDVKTENHAPELSLIPSPKKILNRGGSNKFTKDFWIIGDLSDSTISELASYLGNSLKGLTNQDILITDLYSTRKHNQSIRLEINPGKEKPQGYTLDITTTQIKIDAGNSQGLYYGIKTLLQILNSIESRDSTFSIPKVIIKDSPSKLIRGVLVNSTQVEGEHYIMSLIMGMFKLNKLVIDNYPESVVGLNDLTAKNFVHVSSFYDLDTSIPLINFGDSLTDIEEFYTAYKANTKDDGFILDLRSSSNSIFLSKLIIMAEISWTNSNKRSFKELKEDIGRLE